VNIDFSWEVTLFNLWDKVWKKRSSKKGFVPNAETALRFEDIEHNMTFLARSLVQENVFLRVGADVGGVHGKQFIVPREMSLWNDTRLNRRAWVFRIWFMSRIWEQACFLSGQESEEEIFIQTCLAIRECLLGLQKSNPEAFGELRQLIQIELKTREFLSQGESVPLEQLLRWSVFEATSWQQLPATERSLPTSGEVAAKLLSNDTVIPPFMLLFGRLMTMNHVLETSEIIEGIDLGDEESSTDGTEKEAPAMDRIESAEFSKKDQQDAVLLHSFEKVECLDDYNGMARDFDGADEMDDHEEAMQELKLRQIIRTNEETHSIYRADIRLQTEIGDLLEAGSADGIPYPEWDGKKKKYKKDWCWIYPKHAEKSSDQSFVQEITRQYQKTIRQLRKRLEAQRMARKLADRQRDGETVDIDAVVENQCLIQAGQTPSERMYLKKIKKGREVASLILLDLSLSADSYVDGRKILDVCKESLIILGKVLENLGDSVEVAAFYSSTRNECSYIYLKKFHENWDVLYQRINNLEANGYTRIGPALRHATHRINTLPSKKKVIILLSDGKPNDYDKYEGMYGIRDIRQAIREANRKDIQLFALAISNQAYDYLPVMLGKGNYSVVKKTEEMTKSFGDLYQKLMK